MLKGEPGSHLVPLEELKHQASFQVQMNAAITDVHDQVSIVYETELQYLSAPYA